MTELERMIEEEILRARNWIKKGNQVMNHFSIVDRDLHVHNMVTPWRDGDERFVFLEIVRHYCAKHDAVRYIHCSEAWAAEATEDTKDLMPSDNPARQEVLMVGGADRETGERIMKMFHIATAPDNSRLLSDEHEISKGGEAYGDSLNLLEKPTQLS